MFFNEKTKNKVFKGVEKKVQTHNAATYYQLSRFFHIPNLYKTTFIYIERCFSVVTETKSFLELDFNSISNLLASSNLLIDSEVQVYNAGNTWLKYNIEERCKFAKLLLLKVRLNLLSNRTLKFLLDESSGIAKNNECIDMLNDMNIFIKNKTIVYSRRRFCDDEMFSILICGGFHRTKRKQINEVKQIEINNLFKIKNLTPMKRKLSDLKTVCMKGEVYVIGGVGVDRSYISIEKYSFFTKTWSKVTELPQERYYFCTSAFMGKIYILGGGYRGMFNSCFQLDAKNSEWKEVASMNDARYCAACTTFDGNIVISGGGFYENKLNTVESYDVFADAWTPMPSMIERRWRHRLVCVRSKLFVIDECTCEQFDKICNRFTTLKSPRILNIWEAITIGNKIFVLQSYCESVVCYDVDNDDWSEELCEATRNISRYSSVAVPLY